MGSCFSQTPSITDDFGWDDDPYADWNDTSEQSRPDIARISENMKHSTAALTLEKSLSSDGNKCTTFSTNLHRQLINTNTQNHNVVCSPLSVLVGMASCMNGARNNTLRQIVDVLFPDEQTNYSPKEVEELSTEILKMAPYYNKVYPGSDDMYAPMVRMAHKMWIQKGIHIQKDFLTSSGIGELETMNLSNPRKAAKHINGWCATNTHDIIQRVVTAEDLEHARWIIANVIYFKAKFCRRFLPKDTKPEKFYTDWNRQEMVGQIATMHSDKPRYYKLNHNGFDVIRLDFRAAQRGASDLSLILAIRSDGRLEDEARDTLQDPHRDPHLEQLQLKNVKMESMHKLQSASHTMNSMGDSTEFNALPPSASSADLNVHCFTPSDIVDIGESWTHGEVLLYVPKFKYEWTGDINRDLLDLGIIDAFNQNADFSGITGTNSFFIDKVIHKAVIELDEYGVEASAACVDIGQGKGIIPPKPKKKAPTIRYNHPFDLYIWDRKAEMSLFAGRFNGIHSL